MRLIAIFSCLLLLGTQGPSTPTNVVNDNSAGTLGWQGLPTAVQSDDATYASLATGLPPASATQFCKATEFDFSQVPDCLTDITVTFTVKRKYSGGVAAKDNAARVVLAGVVQSTDYSSTTSWTTTDTAVNYVVTGLSSADVKDTGFGFALSAKNPLPGGGRVPVTTAPYIGYIEATASW